MKEMERRKRKRNSLFLSLTLFLKIVKNVVSNLETKLMNWYKKELGEPSFELNTFSELLKKYSFCFSFFLSPSLSLSLSVSL